MGKKIESKKERKKNRELKDSVVTAQAKIQELESEIQKLESIVTALWNENHQLKKSLSKALAPADPPARKIGRWNIVKSGKYYRAFCRIDGKLHGIYLGKSLQGAAQKIKTREAVL